MIPDAFINKSTVREIEERFDREVNRFSNLDTGQSSTVDAPLAMELITDAAVCSSSPVRRILDIGCGAGNNTLKLFEKIPPCPCDLVDLSRPMLEMAHHRLSKVSNREICTFQGDIRDLVLPGQYDVIFAAAVLHHLRDDRDWEQVFRKLYSLTAHGGSLWITDLVSHESLPVQQMMWHRYGQYLENSGGSVYRDKVFTYIEKEDSPRPVTFQLELLRRVGYAKIDLLHKNSCFAAFGAVKQ